MKILHIYDTSGSSSIMARYQRKLGHNVLVITNKKLDRFNISEFYQSVLFNGSALEFYLYSLKLARKFDVIHVHSLVIIFRTILFINMMSVLVYK